MWIAPRLESRPPPAGIKSPSQASNLRQVASGKSDATDGRRGSPYGTKLHKVPATSAATSAATAAHKCEGKSSGHSGRSDGSGPGITRVIKGSVRNLLKKAPPRARSVLRADQLPVLKHSRDGTPMNHLRGVLASPEGASLLHDANINELKVFLAQPHVQVRTATHRGRSPDSPPPHPRSTGPALSRSIHRRTTSP